MLGVGTILYVQHVTGSYGTGGTVVAASTLGEAVFAARLGRALDRFGQRRSHPPRACSPPGCCSPPAR